MGKYFIPILAILIVTIGGGGVNGRPQKTGQRQPKQLMTSVANVLNSIMDGGNEMISSALTQEGVLQSLLRRSAGAHNAALISNLMPEFRKASNEISYIRNGNNRSPSTRQRQNFDDDDDDDDDDVDVDDEMDEMNDDDDDDDYDDDYEDEDAEYERDDDLADYERDDNDEDLDEDDEYDDEYDDDEYDDEYNDGYAQETGRKKNPQIPVVPQSMSDIIGNTLNSVTRYADGKLKQLINMSSKTGKLVSDTTKSISRVLGATRKFTKKFEKQKDKFDAKLTKEKLKLIENTKMSLSKFLKELAKISDSKSSSRSLMRAQNEFIDLARQTYVGIFDETARGILKLVGQDDGVASQNSNIEVKNQISSVEQASQFVSRMFTSASSKLSSLQRLTKNLTKAINAARKLKKGSKKSKKIKKKIQKEIEKIKKAKAKLKKKTKKDVEQILNTPPLIHTVSNDPTAAKTSDPNVLSTNATANNINMPPNVETLTELPVVTETVSTT